MSLSSSRLSNTYTEEDIASLFKIAVILRMTYTSSNYVTVSEICQFGNYSWFYVVREKKKFQRFVHSVKAKLRS